MSLKVKAHGALFLVALFYGLAFVWAKDIIPEYIGPFGLVFIRVAVGLIVFTTISSFSNTPKKISKEDFPRIFLCGMFGVGINMLCFFKGLSITGPINASILMLGAPVIVMILSTIILKDKITSRKVLGAILGITGSLTILLLNKKLEFAATTFIGDLFVFINALSYGLYIILVKSITQKYNGITVLKWIFLFGLLIVAPFGLGEFISADYSVIPTKVWCELAFVVICTTIFTYLLNFYAISKLPPTTVSVYIYLQPLIATTVAILLGKDELTLIKVLGGSLICIAVYLVSFKSKSKINV